MATFRVHLKHPAFQKAYGYAFTRSRSVDFIASMEHLSQIINTLNAIVNKDVTLSKHSNKSKHGKKIEVSSLIKFVHRIAFHRDYTIHRLAEESPGKLWRKKTP